MRKFVLFVGIFLLIFVSLSAENYFISVSGNDSNDGSIGSPFATLAKAQSLAEAGDTVYIRGGTYKITEEQIMTYHSIWGYVFDMRKSGTDKNNRICYWGYKNERPIFDLSEVKPANKRVIVFYVKGSFLHFKNFEIIGTQVTILDHTQSECFRNDGANNNIYEHISMHDGKAIGFYLVSGSNNLVLNCDVYNNYDDISDGGSGGNVDGFGGHANVSGTGNIFRGCRAWWNSDDGFDLINCQAAYTIENCWAFYNGYKPNSFISAGNGSGFKSGGYGMSNSPKAPDIIPIHIVRFCLAYYNKNQGFYSNHHLGGITWYNNTGYKNPSNFNMLNRKSVSEAVDVDGYGHIIKNNLSYAPRTSGKNIISVDHTLCEIENNSFLPTEMSIASSDFMSLDESQLMLPRKADGSLPDITFMKPQKGSKLIDSGTDVGFSFYGNAPDIGCFEYNDGFTDINTTDKESFNMWVQDKTLFIFSENKTVVYIHTILGITKAVAIPVGESSILLDNGIYIISINGESKKVLIK